MKVYTKIVVDMESCTVIDEQHIEYSGPVIECKGGGGSTTTTVDPVYNAGMLELSQEQQQWAGEMFNMFKYGVDYDPNEKVQGKYIDGKWVSKDELTIEQTGGEQWIDNPDALPGGEGGRWVETPTTTQGESGRMIPGAPTRTWVQDEGVASQILNPNYQLDEKTWGEIYGYDPNAQTSEMEYLQNLVESNQSLLGLQTETDRQNLELTQKQIGYETGLTDARSELLPQRLALGKSFLNDAMTGIDVNQRKDQAQAGVQHGFKRADEAQRINMGQYGLDPNSGMFASQSRDRQLAEATGIAGARTKAGTEAEEQNFNRKAQGLSFNL